MIQKYKDFLDKDTIQVLKEKIKNYSWDWEHRSNPNDTHKFWKVSNLEKDLFYSHTLLNKIKEITKLNLAFSNIYLNGHTSCGYGLPHVDLEFNFSRTFLVFCNDLWKPEWGGYTCFHKDDGDYEIVYPHPWTGVLFDGSKKHHATPISSHCEDLRITLAFKCIDLENINV